MVIDKMDENILSNSERYQCFFVFDPGSMRVSESDIYIGQSAVDFLKTMNVVQMYQI